LNEFPLAINQICELIDLVETKQVSFSNASGKVLGHLLNNPDSKPKEVAKSLGLIQENNEGLLLLWVEEVISAMPEKVKEYKSGKKGLIGMFAGEVKKKSKGAADMQQVNQLLTQKLNS
jgi:aspartyl-tRNA(Asn)/glutamyl-tRNA(Gln) amidotransferase subunit B